MKITYLGEIGFGEELQCLSGGPRSPRTPANCKEFCLLSLWSQLGRLTGRTRVFYIVSCIILYQPQQQGLRKGSRLDGLPADLKLFWTILGHDMLDVFRRVFY